MHTFRPVEVRAQAGISAGAMLWRYKGALHVTAIVKATFSMAPDGTVSLAAPEPLLPADAHRDDDPRRSLLHATDRVPFRPQADVVLTGSAHAAGGRGQRAIARLGVRRDRVLIDKTIHVLGTPATSYWFSSVPLAYEHAFGGPGHVDNPVGTGTAPANLIDPRGAGHAIGFGPIDPSWPVRARLFGSADRGALDVPIAEVPADLDWAFFQTAPPDQRTDYLHGDEWLLLEGLHPEAMRIIARLPGVRAHGTVHGRIAVGAPDTQPLELDADGLHIDADRLACTMTWRAAMPLAADCDLGKISLALGITIDGKEEEAAPATVAQPAPPTERLPGIAAYFDGTMALSSEAIEQAMHEASPLPFAPGPRSGATPGDAGLRPRTPGAKAPESVAARPPTAPRPAPRDFDGTLDLTNALTAPTHTPAWLAAARSKTEGAVALQVAGRVVVTERKQVDETIQVTSELLAASGPAPFPIAPAGIAGPATTEATPWAATPPAPAPLPWQAVERTIDLTPVERPELDPVDEAPAEPTPSREHEPPSRPEPVASPPPAPPPPERREERVISVREPDPPPPPAPPAPPPRPRPPPKPDRNEGLYERFSLRKK